MPDSPPSRSSAPSDLLRTKLAPSRLPAALVPRQRLLDRLEAGLARRLTLVVGPAGFGKSTLVAEWLAARAGPSGWVSLEAGDNDPVRFWTYFLTACRGFHPSLGKAALAALRAAQPVSFEALLAPFLNELARLSGTPRDVLVLEDYHAITAPAIHESLAFVLDHLPPAGLHVVLISRDEPPLPIPRWRARDELSELTALDLRFSRDETRAFLEQALGRPTSPATLAHVNDTIEGWAAGLRLVALGLQSRPDPRAADAFMATVGGGFQLVGDYLVSEVLAAQPESLQKFLLQTSGLARLSASLCDAVTGRTDSGQVLQGLARANLFIAPLEGAGQAWYRYHVLFAEVLRQTARQRLGEPELQAVQSRASRWCDAQGLGQEAIEAALLAHEFERAASLAEQSIELRGQSEVATLRRWLEQLPRDVLHAHPSLCFSYAFADLFTFDRRSLATPARLEDSLRAAEDGWRREGNEAGLGQILSLRSSVKIYSGRRTSLRDVSGRVSVYAGSDAQLRGVGTLVQASTGGALDLECEALEGESVKLQAGRDLRCYIRSLDDARLLVSDLGGSWEGRIGAGRVTLRLNAGGDVTLVTSHEVTAHGPDLVLGRIERPAEQG